MAGTSADFTIGEMSRRTGCKVETIRYYERIGIMPKPPRNPGNHRVYGAEHVKRLAFVRRSRELGFSLGEVRALLALVDGGIATCAEVRCLTLTHLADIREKMRDLSRLEATLTEISDRCSGEQIPDCPILDALWSE